MMNIPILNSAEIVNHLENKSNPFFQDYYAFYSSWFGGILKNPPLMLIPFDDHMVHRGDGVFEAFKVVSGTVYLFDEHLKRLFTSANKIDLNIPFSVSELKEIVIKTIQVADKEDALIRMYVSRGPGNLSANPYDSVGPQVYVAITKLDSIAPLKYEKGVTLGKSAIPVKSPWLAQVKSCNYLPNVLMKKEAVDRGIDYVIGVTDDGYITESATENVMIVNKDGILGYPSLNDILRGTTMIRACELAFEHGIKSNESPISLEDLLSAREVMMVGTTINVLPAIKFEEHLIGNGRPGPIAKLLLELIQEDMISIPSRSVVNK